MPKKEVKEPKSKTCKVCEEDPCTCEVEKSAPEEAGEETSEIVELGGALYRAVRTGDEVTYVPLQMLFLMSTQSTRCKCDPEKPCTCGKRVLIDYKE